MSDTIPTKAAAEACDTTPRVLRPFLRASKDYEAVGSGGRYAFTEDDLPELKTRFAAWLAEREAAAKAKEKASAASAAASRAFSSANVATSGTGTRWVRRNRPPSPSTPPFSCAPSFPGRQ